jgi:hypothetical protein
MSDEELAEMTVDSVGLEEAATSEENEPVENVEVEEPETEQEEEAESDQVEQTDQEAEPESEVKEEPAKDKKNGVQKRINELTLKRKEAERKADELEVRLQELEGRKQVEKDHQVAPNIDDFEDYEAYETKLIDFKVEEKLKHERYNESVRTKQIRGQQVQAAFNDRVSKADLEGYKEASEALIESKALPPHLIGDLLEHEKGPELVKFLGEHLDVADSLNNMTQNQALLKLGELSVNLSNVKKTKQITKAPDPIDTISGSGTKSKDTDDMDVGEIIKMLRKKKR